MTHLTETDMRDFEGALDEKWCHLFWTHNSDGTSCCGQIARAEQPRHGSSRRCGTWPDTCPWCGARFCPECRAARR